MRHSTEGDEGDNRGEQDCISGLQDKCKIYFIVIGLDWVIDILEHFAKIMLLFFQGII